LRCDSIIIGAGMSGLAAGIRLSRLDRHPIVLERHAIWGGLNSFYSIGGRKFDVGLHALTNHAPPEATGSLLGKLLRRLGIDHADLALGEQGFSQILFPGLRLTFTNEVHHLEEEVARLFPAEKDRFAKLIGVIRETKAGNDDAAVVSGRRVLGEMLGEAQLIEMLLLPTCYYGSATEDDIDWGLFTVLFRSIFIEGLARPAGGIRPLLKLLVKCLKAAGGEIRCGSGVKRIRVHRGAVVGVELDDGEEIDSDHVLSCAGGPETMRLCGEGAPPGESLDSRSPAAVGRLSFLESISVLEGRPAEIGLEAATSFFCTEERFRWACPHDLADPTSGAISVADNFDTDPPPPEGTIRLSTLANHDRWCALSPEEYARAKERCADEAIAAAGACTSDWRSTTVFRDIFTPKTIHRFTSRLGGAVYGSPEKCRSGETGIAGLQLCGADQGFPGVIGALASGVEMATRHAAAGDGRRRT
jgi:phytoene dehydrogenase-like protein